MLYLTVTLPKILSDPITPNHPHYVMGLPSYLWNMRSYNVHILYPERAYQVLALG